MTVSEPNPERCRACHGSPPRPVWDTYPLWPGAYGETPSRAAPARERSGWASFSRLRSHDARYRYLVDPKETALDEAARRYTGAATVLRNAELSELFGALNAKAVASELRASPRFNGARDALLIALATPCGDIEEALPEDARASFRRDYDGFARGAAEANAVQDAYKAQRAEPPLPTPLRSLALAPAMIRLRYVAEHELGVPSAGWTLALEKGSYDFASAARPAESFERKLFAELAGSDERLLAVYWNGSDTRALCSLLREPGRVASGGSRLSPHGVSGVEARPEAMLVERCASCHEGGAGPPIPFGDPARLAPELARSTRTRSSLLDDIRFRLDGAAGAERMPVGFNPTPEVRAQLLTYLSDLSKRNVSIPRR